MDDWLQKVELIGKRVKLVPLEVSHKETLLDAASDGKLWELWYTSVPSFATVEKYIGHALSEQKDKKALPFVVIDTKTDKIIGSTRYMNVEVRNRRLEIGSTWYAKSFQRTGVNTECKYLLLQHAFENLNCIAVEFRTHWFNYKSRNAIARLGAKQDGVLRNHKIDQTGNLPDTVVFSIVDQEWPTVKNRLNSRWPNTLTRMRIDIITVLPELLKSPFEASILKRAIEKGLVEVHMHNLRDYTDKSYKQVDDYQFGGGAGMVLMIEPIDKCITALKSKRDYDEIIYMTPDGETLNQKMANRLSLLGNIIILCGHYKGVDQRVRDSLITKEISIGDYVLSGGELGAAVLCDTLIRLIPGVLNNETSALTDTFQDNLLAPPVYTRPAEYKGMKVPDVLLSGNFQKIEAWRENEALRRTEKLRSDLLKK